MKNACLDYHEFSVEDDLAGVPHRLGVEHGCNEQLEKRNVSFYIGHELGH